MRFTIEQRHLTDEGGKPVVGAGVQYHVCDAESVSDAVRLFIRKKGAEIIGEIVTFPGFQAVATVRDMSGVYTLQLSPASGQVAC
ncbi:MAG TPA: hypothetical protein VF057_07375 [Thermoanaerobaculia bacterium]